MLLLGLSVLGFVAHTFVWLWLTGLLTAGFSDWVSRQRARGWEVEHALPSRSGWPFTASLRVPDFRMAGWSPLLQDFSWRAGEIALTIAPTHVGRLTITADGAQRVRSGPTIIPYTAERLRLLVPLDHGAPPQPMELLIEGLQATAPDGPVRAARVHATVVPEQDGRDGVGIHLAATEIILPPTLETHPFGRMIAGATAEATLTGPPPSPFPLTIVERAEAWRDGGGQLEVEQLVLNWGPLAATLRMTFSLDAALQPEGTGRLLLERPSEALDAVTAAGLLDPRTATGVHAMLALLTRAPANGGAPQLDVPVALQRRNLTVARFPLMRLPALTWPRTAPRIL